MEFTEVMENIAQACEVVGVAIIVLGGLYALTRPVLRTVEGRSYFEEARRRLAHPLLLGLEVLVAADIIQTITVDPSLESVATLGILILIRVVLSFSLDIEIDGMVPWRRAQNASVTKEQSPSGD